MQELLPRVESGTKTENNAYVLGWTVVEQCRSNCRGAIVETQRAQRKAFTGGRDKRERRDENHMPNRMPSCRHAFSRYPSLILALVLITRTHLINGYRPSPA